MWAVRLQTGACCWCHLLITSMYDQRERSSLQQGLVLGSALSGQNRSKNVFHNITFNFYWEGTSKGIRWNAASGDIFNKSFFGFSEDLHKVHPFSFNAPSESYDLSLLGSQSPTAAPTVLPVNQASRLFCPHPCFRTHKGHVVIYLIIYVLL